MAAFSTSIQAPIVPVPLKALKATSEGIGKKINTERAHDKRQQLTTIKEEIDWLIEINQL